MTRRTPPLRRSRACTRVAARTLAFQQAGVPAATSADMSPMKSPALRIKRALSCNASPGLPTPTQRRVSRGAGALRRELNVVRVDEDDDDANDAA